MKEIKILGASWQNSVFCCVGNDAFPLSSDLLTVAPGLKADMDFSDKSVYEVHVFLQYVQHILLSLWHVYFVLFHSNVPLLLNQSKDAKTAKAPVNLLSLLSTFDDIIDVQPEGQETGQEGGVAPKLPRTNSLEELGIKVWRTVSSIREVAQSVIKEVVISFEPWCFYMSRCSSVVTSLLPVSGLCFHPHASRSCFHPGS